MAMIHRIVYHHGQRPGASHTTGARTAAIGRREWSDPRRKSATRSEHGGPGRRARKQDRDRREEQRHLPDQPQRRVHPVRRDLHASRKLAQQERPEPRHDDDREHRRPTRHPRRTLAKHRQDAEQGNRSGRRQGARVAGEWTAPRGEIDRWIEQAGQVRVLIERNERRAGKRDGERSESLRQRPRAAPNADDEEDERERERDAGARTHGFRDLLDDSALRRRVGAHVEQALPANGIAEDLASVRRIDGRREREAAQARVLGDALGERSRQLVRRRFCVEQRDSGAASVGATLNDLHREIEWRRDHGEPVARRIDRRANHAGPGERAVPVVQHDTELVALGDQRREMIECVGTVVRRVQCLARGDRASHDGVVERAMQLEQPARGRGALPLVPAMRDEPKIPLCLQSQTGGRGEQHGTQCGPHPLRSAHQPDRRDRQYGGDDQGDQILYAGRVKPLARGEERRAGGDRPPGSPRSRGAHRS
jgi:hypothetical protein